MGLIMRTQPGIGTRHNLELAKGTKGKGRNKK